MSRHVHKMLPGGPTTVDVVVTVDSGRFGQPPTNDEIAEALFSVGDNFKAPARRVKTAASNENAKHALDCTFVDASTLAACYARPRSMTDDKHSAADSILGHLDTVNDLMRADVDATPASVRDYLRKARDGLVPLASALRSTLNVAIDRLDVMACQAADTLREASASDITICKLQRLNDELREQNKRLTEALCAAVTRK